MDSFSEATRAALYESRSWCIAISELCTVGQDFEMTTLCFVENCTSASAVVVVVRMSFDTADT